MSSDGSTETLDSSREDLADDFDYPEKSNIDDFETLDITKDVGQINLEEVAEDTLDNKKEYEKMVAKPKVEAAQLHKMSLEAKMDSTLTYDLGDGDLKQKRSVIIGWLNKNLPSKTKRSDKIGKITMMSENRTLEQKKHLESPMERELKAFEDWKLMLKSSQGLITYNTFKHLAAKHGVMGGKWIMHLKTKFVDQTWKKMAWDLAYGKFPKNVLHVSATPLDDSNLEVPQDQGSHVVSVWNTDYTDEDTILKVEETIRKSGNKMPLIYKPDIFSAIGIYRNNEWKLRPAIYSSKFDKETGKGVIESGLDLAWSFNCCDL